MLRGLICTGLPGSDVHVTGGIVAEDRTANRELLLSHFIPHTETPKRYKKISFSV